MTTAETKSRPPEYSPLLALPQELRDQIYSFLFLPATATTEHPFTSCISPNSRFTTYHAITLVNRFLHSDTKAYFTKHIIPNVTFHFTSLPALHTFQSQALVHPLLKEANFHIRSALPTGNPSPSHPYHQTRVDEEKIEALIGIQPGYKPWIDDLPGFYRSHPPPNTPPFGRIPATGPKAWKPRKRGVAIFQQTGGEVCDSPTCPQLRGGGVTEEVTEVRFPALQQGTWSQDESEGNLVAGEKGSLSLSCFIWTKDMSSASGSARAEVSIMALEGELRDVWVPGNPVEVHTRQYSARLAARREAHRR